MTPTADGMHSGEDDLQARGKKTDTDDPLAYRTPPKLNSSISLPSAPEDGGEEGDDMLCLNDRCGWQSPTKCMRFGPGTISSQEDMVSSDF